ncbi:MAG TPA: hypothetical protein VHT53_06210 [Candidatus Elarobacter sp.]|nr:hypothetical protein [Candidatus Elarobacter sp.]
MRNDLRALTALAAALLGGCGGGSSLHAAVPHAAASGSGATAPLTITVHIPAPSTAAGSRLAQYVSSGTAGFEVGFAPDGKAFEWSYTTGKCTGGTCSATVDAPLGKIDLELDLLDTHGRPLSIAQTVTTIAPASANTISVVFDGFPSTIVLTPVAGSPTSFTSGVAGTITFRMTMLDVTGEVISGQGNIVGYVLLTTNDVSSAVSVTPSLLDGGAIATNAAGTIPNTVTLAYDGTPASVSTITFQASDDATAAQYRPVTITAPSIPITGSAPAFSASSATGVNVATQTQQNGNTWLGYVPAAATKASAVAVSLQMPQIGDGFWPASVSVTLGGSAQPFAARRSVRSVTRPSVSGRVYDMAHKPFVAKLRRSGRALDAGRAAAFARRAQSLSVGAQQHFWVSKFDISSSNVTYVNTPYVLGAVTAHGAIWIDATPGTKTSQTSPSTINSLANQFETAWSVVSTYYGSTSYAGSTPPGSFVTPACDPTGTGVTGYDVFPIADPGYMNVLITDQTELGANVGGYNSPTDYFPADVANCFGAESNAAPTITIGYSGSGSALEPMAHEYAEVAAFVQHAIARGGDEEGNNVLDGLATVAQDLAVGHPSQSNIALATVYLANPQNFILTEFSGFDDGVTYSDNCEGCYGETYLFFRYLVDRFGTGILAQIAQSGQTSMANISAATGLSPQQLVKDFATMLAVSGTGITPASDKVTNLQTFPLRAPFIDANGYAWSAQQLTPQPVLTAASTAQTATMFRGSFAFFDVPPPGTNGNAVKVVDTTSQLSLWLSVATK